MRRRCTIAFALGALAALTSGCLPQTEGLYGVSSLVHERGNHTLNWDALQGREKPNELTTKLLSGPLSANRAAQIALLNNPAMQAALEDLGIARAQLLSAMQLPNPRAEFGLGFSDEPESPDIHIGGHISLTQLIFLAPRYGVAHAQMDKAKLMVAGATLDLAYQAKTAFIRYQAATQILELRQTVLKAAYASYDVTKRIHEAGNIPDLKYLSEKAAYEVARLAHAQAETMQRTAREELNAVLGLWGPPAMNWTIAGQLPDPDDEEPTVVDLEQNALAQSLDLGAIRHAFTAAARRANLAQAEAILPDISAGAEAEREGGHFEVGPTVGITIPLFYQGQGETSAAESMMRRQRQMYARTALEVRASARATAIRLEAARDRVHYVRDVIIPLRTRITEETLLTYNAMSTGLVQVLAAKRDEVEAGRLYVEAVRDYWLVRADVDQLMAGRVPTMMGAATDGGGAEPVKRSGDGH